MLKDKSILCLLCFVSIVLLLTSPPLGARSRDKFSSADVLEVNRLLWHSQNPQSEVDESAYPLSTPDDLIWFSQQAALGKSFFLANDIDMQGKSFDPIFVFIGSLDGRHHTIRNLSINPSNTINPGFKNFSMFAQINSATIRDLTLDGMTSTIPNTNGLIVTGALAGEIMGSKLSNIHIKNSKITLSNSESIVSLNLGGFAGFAQNSQITSSRVEAEISVNCQISVDQSFRNIGGFIGRSAGESTFDDCHSTGTINVTNTLADSFLTCGGFVAYGQADTFLNSSSQNTISITALEAKQLSLGGFAGYLTDATLSGSSFAGNMSAQIQSLSSSIHMLSYGMGFNLGGFASRIENTTIAGCKSNGTMTFSGDFVGGMGGFLGITDSRSSITDSVSAVTAMDLSNATFQNQSLENNSNFYAGIGGFVGVSNTAYYDKNTVALDTELFINCPIGLNGANSIAEHQYSIGGFAARVGAMTSTDNAARITNSRVEKIRIDSPAIVGGFIGYASGLTGVQADGRTPFFSQNTVGTATLTCYNGYMGGFAGYLDNSMLSDSKVETATVTIGQGATSVEYLGGFVGYSNASLISNGYANATINLLDATDTLVTGTHIGGFAGFSNGAYKDKDNFYQCSAEGFIQSGDNSTNIGGFIGSLAESGSAFSCFSTASITSGSGSSNLGGFVGLLCGGSSILYAYSQGPVTVTGDDVSDYGGFAGKVTGSSMREAIGSGAVLIPADKKTLLGIITDTAEFVLATSALSEAEVLTPIALISFADDLSDFVDAGQVFIQDFSNRHPKRDKIGGFMGHADGVSTFSDCYFDINTTQLANTNSSEGLAGINAVHTTELSFYNNKNLMLNPYYWYSEGNYPALIWE